MSLGLGFGASGGISLALHASVGVEWREVALCLGR